MSHAPGGQFADPVDAWIENATIEVDINEADDSVQIFGNDGPNNTGTNRAVLTDSDGRLIVDLGPGIPVTMGGPGLVTVGNTSTQLLAANPNRKYAAIVNDSSEDLYISFGAPAVMNSGIRLNKKGGSYEINSLNLTLQEINGITASGGNNATTTEAT